VEKLKCRPLYDASAHSAFPAATRCRIYRRERQAIPFCVEILARPAVHSLRIDDPVLRKFQPCIQRSHAIARIREIAARKKTADVRLIAEFARHAHHAVRRSRVVRAAGESLPRPPVVDDHGAPASTYRAFPSRACRTAGPRCGAKKQIDRVAKNPAFSMKNGRFSGKKNSEALVDGELRVVGFHLAEVRIQRDIERHRIFGHKLRIEARAVLEFIHEPGRAAARLIQKVVVGQQPIRNELNVPPWRTLSRPATGANCCVTPPRAASRMQ